MTNKRSILGGGGSGSSIIDTLHKALNGGDVR